MTDIGLGSVRSPHPLVELHFEWSDNTRTTRHWYHVPRVGDRVKLDDRFGEVVEIHWLDEHVVLFVSQLG